MLWVPPSLPRNDLQSSRRLVRASALCSLISDRTPWRSSSSPIMHKQEQRLREQTEPQGSPRIWGAPGQAVHRAEHRTATSGSLLPCLSAPHSPRTEGEPSPRSLQTWPGQTRAREIRLPTPRRCAEAHTHKCVGLESQKDKKEKMEQKSSLKRQWPWIFQNCPMCYFCFVNLI